MSKTNSNGRDGRWVEQSILEPRTFASRDDLRDWLGSEEVEDLLRDVGAIACGVGGVRGGPVFPEIVREAAARVTQDLAALLAAAREAAPDERIETFEGGSFDTPRGCRAHRAALELAGLCGSAGSMGDAESMLATMVPIVEVLACSATGSEDESARVTA